MDTVSCFQNRFSELIGDDSYTHVASRIGVSKQTISAYANGVRNAKKPTINAIATHYGVDPLWLIGFDVPKYPIDVFPVATNIIPLPKTKKIPLLGDIACGDPILTQENIADYIDADEGIRADFALVCKGDSMINARIFDGDVVYIRAQPTVESGEIAAVLIGDEATLKRVKFYDDHIVLEPENPTFRPLAYWGSEMDSVRIIGKAVAFTSTIR